jgi:hypothetical protein
MKIEQVLVKDDNLHCKEMREMFDRTPAKVYINTVIALIFAVSIMFLAAFAIKYKETVFFNCSAVIYKDSTVFKFYANYQDYLQIKDLHKASILVTTEKGIIKTQTINFRTIGIEKLTQNRKFKTFTTYPILSPNDYILSLTTSDKSVSMKSDIEYGQIKFFIGEKKLISRFINRKN